MKGVSIMLMPIKEIDWETSKHIRKIIKIAKARKSQRRESRRELVEARS
jgi:hypothetical protein